MLSEMSASNRSSRNVLLPACFLLSVLVACLLCGVCSSSWAEETSEHSASADRTDAGKARYEIVKLPETACELQYVLLIVGEGEEMRTRWLAWDEDAHAIYIDQNGNGDLTEADERVALEETRNRRHEKQGIKIDDSVSLGVTYEELSLRRRREDGKRLYRYYCRIEVISKRGHQRVNVTPHIASAKAPVAHACGPMSIKSIVPRALSKSGDGINIRAIIETRYPGVKTLQYSYSFVPKEIKPELEIEYTHQDTGESLKKKFILSKRC